MAESTLNFTVAQIKAEIGSFLGYSRTAANWNSDQTADILDVYTSGLRLFIYESGHAWNFLRQIGNIGTTQGQPLYTLPDNFAGSLSDFTFSAGDKRGRIGIIDELQYRALVASNNSNAQPLYAAVRPVTGNASVRWQLCLYPTPDASYNLLYRYATIPDLSDGGAYPPGGSIHAEALLESCLSVAEQRTDDGDSKNHQTKFAALLAQSIALDKQTAETTVATPWPVALAPTGGDIGYPELISHVGKKLGYGWDPATFNHEQLNLCDSVVQQGYRRKLYPHPTTKGEPAHAWTYLQPVNAIATVKGQSSYPLPDSFVGLLGNLTYLTATPGRDGQVTMPTQVEVVNDIQIRSALAANSNQAPPVYCSTRQIVGPGGGSVRWQLELYPIPDAAYTLSFSYLANPPKLSYQDPIPWCGPAHAETLRESCLSVAEARLEKPTNTHWMLFESLLAQSIRLDKQIALANGDHPWPITGDRSSLGLTYRDLLREAGMAMGFGWDPFTFTHAQKQACDVMVDQAYRKVLFPHAMQGQPIAYEWSFMKTEGGLTTAPNQDTYPLPADYASVDGDLYWNSNQTGWNRIPIRGIQELRNLQQTLQPQVGQPQYAAITQQPNKGKHEQAWEIVLFPMPDAVYSFNFKYKLNPARLSDANPFPLGGMQHAETYLQSVLSVCELRTFELKGVPVMGRARRPYIPKPQSDEFEQRLSASIALDSRNRPRSLGYNRDSADQDTLVPLVRGSSITVSGITI